MADERSVPARTGRSETREKASRFLAFAAPCESPEAAGQTLAGWKREFHDATHIAFAWRLGPPESAQTRASDAGEPSGTAGKPIASAIESADLTDVIVGVVRYFGGTKLGTGGLARAYRAAAAGAVADAGRTTRVDTRVVTVACGYDRVGELRRFASPPGIVLAGETFGESVRARLAVYPSRLPALLGALDEARFAYEVEPAG